MKNTNHIYYTLGIDEVLSRFAVSPEVGLLEKEVVLRQKKYGLNSYFSNKTKSGWIIFFEQLQSPIVYLLFFGTAVSLYFKDYREALAILIVILMNTLIGFLMEMQARNSMKALSAMDIIYTKVLRGGQVETIPAEQLTLGDIVILEAGDIVPGDGRILVANQLKCDESSLTGESIPSEKKLSILPEATELGDLQNMVFKGSSVMNGTGKVIITEIGKHTQLGKIRELSEKYSETDSPLDKKLAVLSRKLIWLILILTLIFAITGVIQNKDWLIILKTSIVLAVAGFPEGLPIVSTVALANGMLLMGKRNALVKQLSAVETLGSTTVILTDKTGTLTENKIHVETISFSDKNYQAYTDNIHFLTSKDILLQYQKNYDNILIVSVLCNDVRIKNASTIELIGDPIEIALIQFAETSGVNIKHIRKRYNRIGEVPFNSEDKIMGTLHEIDGRLIVAAKGSVEDLLKKCTQIQKNEIIEEIDEDNRLKILENSEKMAKEGLRVLAFAISQKTDIQKESFLEQLVYLGMIAFLDSPRKDIKESVRACKDAGIKVVMITGDHPLTALNIAHKIGLVHDKNQEYVMGKEISNKELPENKWRMKILNASVFARTSPQQKLEIAEVFQNAGNIVAMTGDGVNDTPALKKADVGIAMGIRGTQVAKDTANIILKDDSFGSIVVAIAHGRVIFQNIRKFVIYLISCNLSEIFIITSLGFIAPKATLLPLQILFLNMFTDVFPALALGLGKGGADVMKVPPRKPNKELIDIEDWKKIIVYALIMSASVIMAVWYSYTFISSNHILANHVAFITLAFTQLFHVFNMSSEKNSGIFVNDITQNRFIWLAVLICSVSIVSAFLSIKIRLILGLESLPISIWIIAILASIQPVIVIQLYKYLCQIYEKSKNYESI